MLSAQVKKLSHSQGLQQTVLTVGGNTVATGFSAISLMIISRLLGPSLFGEFSVGFAIVIIVSKLADFGFSSALFKFVGADTNHKHQSQYLSISLRIRFLLGLALVSFGFILSPYLVSFLHLEHNSIIYISLVAGFMTSFYEYLIAALQSLHLFGKAVLANAAQAIFKTIGAVIFLILQTKSLIPVYTWYIAAPLLPILLARWFFPKQINFNLLTIAKKHKAQLVRMASHSSITYISNSIIEHLGVLFVQGFLTSFEAGLLGGTYRIALLFSLISTSLGNVLFPRVARYKRKKDLKAYIGKAVALSIASIFSFFLFLPVAKFVLVLTIGPEYLSGVMVLYILLASVFLQIATIPLIALFYSFKQIWYFSVSGSLLLITTVVGNILFLEKYGLMAAAWTQLIARLLVFILTAILSIWLLRKNKVI
jgi:O-antigen/teichoic acid export membrane protein